MLQITLLEVECVHMGNLKLILDQFWLCNTHVLDQMTVGRSARQANGAY